MNLRIFVVDYYGDNKAAWGCYQGHRWKAKLMDRRKGQNRFITEEGMRFFASWWSEKKGGVHDRGACKECAKEETND